MDGAVQGPVAAAVEPVPDGVAAAGRDGAGAAEGKTPREIRRCLKRYIARELYRQLNRSMKPLTSP